MAWIMQVCTRVLVHIAQPLPSHTGCLALARRYNVIRQLYESCRYTNLSSTFYCRHSVSITVVLVSAS